MRARSSTMAAPSAAASSAGARRMWKASRAAVFSPMPGSLASCWMSLAIGPAVFMPAPSPAEQAGRQGQATGGPGQLLLGQLPGALEGQVDRSHHQVLDQLLVATHDRRVDGQREDLAAPVGSTADQAPAGLGLDRLGPQLI